MKRRTRITIETERTLVVSRRRHAAEGWCEACAELVTMITPEMAAADAGLRLRAIYRLIESGRLHFIETPDGQLSICLSSLAVVRQSSLDPINLNQKEQNL